MNATTKNALAPAETAESAPLLIVRAAPGLLADTAKAVREDGESDARYQARSELFDMLVGQAKED